MFFCGRYSCWNLGSDEKLIVNDDVAKSLSIAVVPADIMNMIQAIRNYQQQLARIQTNPAWVDQTNERVKNATGRHFGEQNSKPPTFEIQLYQGVSYLVE